MCRSGRIGAASGSVTGGKLKLRQARDGTRSRGGNRLPLGDQKPVGRDAQCRVMMEAAPAAPLVMAEPEFLLQFLVIPLDAPAQLGEIDETLEGDVVRQRREPVFRRLFRVLGPLDQQPFFAMGLVAMGGAHAHAGKARG